jgi:hypothetical protein
MSDVPARDGRVVWMGDSHHDGTDVYWSERDEEYRLVGLDSSEIGGANRLVLVELPTDEPIPEDAPWACDLDHPNGLYLVGVDHGDDLSWIPPEDGRVLWDSAAAR